MTGNERKNTGSGFEKVTRERVDNLTKTFEDFRKNDFHHVLETVENIRDNLLKRVPWPVTVVISLLTSTCSALIVFGVMKSF